MRLFDPGSGRCFPVDDRRLRRLALQPFRQPVFIGQRFARGPTRGLAQRLERGLRAILGLAYDAGEISIPHNGDKAGNAARAVLVQLDELRARHFRAQHPAVQHFRQRQIVNETGMREHLVGNVDALDGASRQRPPRRGFGRSGRCLAIQRDLACQFPITGADVAGSRYLAVADGKRVDADAKALGGQAKKDLPDFRTDVANRAAGLLHGQAAGGDAFVGTACRGGADRPHAAYIEVEFVGGDLGQRGDDALPDLHLAGRNHHMPFRRNFDP